MKLAEALNARKELEARLTRLEERLHASARVQEGLEPDESPDALYAMLEKAAAELVEIVSRISRTARRHAELDALALRINAIDARIQQANWETELL